MIDIRHGDCIALMAAMEPNTIDAVVTDAPYHLTSVVKRFGAENAAPAKYGTDGAFARASRGFMGQTWDGGDIAFRPETWAEAYRVMKPGAHLVAFGGTRTFHRMMVAIEDAGFELRDTMMWVYGMGFPKSHDVSKGIDKLLGLTRTERLSLKPGRENFVGRDHRKSLRESGALSGKGGFSRPWMYDPEKVEASNWKYAPASPEATQWQGWATALKPAYEPIALFRKPLEKGLTVAQNVLKWGTGALNIDGCRIEFESDADRHGAETGQGTSDKIYGGGKGLRPAEMGTQVFVPDHRGRWPANLVHDGSDEVIAAFPSSKGQQARARNDGAEQGNNVLGTLRHITNNPEPRGDSGSAARFFYSAKASKADRAGSRHPTVKPVALMQWLVRMVTPPGGVVLDPFAGSGTTGAAAELEGFDAVLCEQSAEYVADIRRRFGQEEVAAEPTLEQILAEFA